MNCKRCGKEIVGEIQRYCNDCKRQVRGEVPITEKQVSKSTKVYDTNVYDTNVQQSKESEERVCKKVQEEKKEKKKRVFSFGYIVLALFMIIVTFVISCMVGFWVVPLMPF